MSTVTVASQRVSLDLIDVGENVRELDDAHIDALAGSIELRGLIVPLPVRPIGERFRLVAGHHRHAACCKLGLGDVDVTLRDHEDSAADSAAENVVRKQLSPLEEARAVRRMLEEGYTLDGAASVLGWSRALVGARAKILDLPDAAQQLVGSGELPVSAVDPLLQIAAVSPPLCEAALAPVTEGQINGSQFARDPGWALAHALRGSGTKVFAAYLNGVSSREIAELGLGKKTEAAYAQAEELHRQLDRYAYGPPQIHFGEAEVDQARAAGVLIEFEHGAPVIADRALYRELAKQAIGRTVHELQATKLASDAERETRRKHGKPDRTPQQQLEAEHRAAMRTLTARMHNVNLDLGTELLHKLAVVDPQDMDVARFFAHGLLGPDTKGYLAKDEHTALTIAATGIRLVIDEHRTTTTPTLKSGHKGKTKVAYAEVEDATKWLWKFIDGAKTAGELYGRALVAFAAQHYAHDLVLPRSQRRPSALPSSHGDTARKAFERLTKNALPGSHKQLQRALEREAREHTKRQQELDIIARRRGAVGESMTDVNEARTSCELGRSAKRRTLLFVSGGPLLSP
jgi:ParB/RepB/Spo0J family partition protein